MATVVEGVLWLGRRNRGLREGQRRAQSVGGTEVMLWQAGQRGIDLRRTRMVARVKCFGRWLAQVRAEAMVIMMMQRWRWQRRWQRRRLLARGPGAATTTACCAGACDSY